MVICKIIFTFDWKILIFTYYYVKIYINCSKPGIAIGKGGVGIEKIKEQLCQDDN